MGQWIWAPTSGCRAGAELHQRLHHEAHRRGPGRTARQPDATHRRVTERFRALDDATVTRQADVVYSPGTDPYPTSVADIFGWLTDHYDEHIAQTGQLLESWQAEQAR